MHTDGGLIYTLHCLLRRYLDWNDIANPALGSIATTEEDDEMSVGSVAAQVDSAMRASTNESIGGLGALAQQLAIAYVEPWHDPSPSHRPTSILTECVEQYGSNLCHVADLN